MYVEDAGETIKLKSVGIFPHYSIINPRRIGARHARGITNMTQDCNHIARMRRNQQATHPGTQIRPPIGNPKRNLVPQEQARTILRAQPPILGTAPLRYVDYENDDIGMELVRSQ